MRLRRWCFLPWTGGMYQHFTGEIIIDIGSLRLTGRGHWAGPFRIYKTVRFWSRRVYQEQFGPVNLNMENNKRGASFPKF